MGNGNEADISVVDTGNSSGLTTTTDGESDVFDNYDMDLSSPRDTDEDYC